MPEGHLIHRLARRLNSEFSGQPVTVTSPQGRFATEATMLDGQRLTRAEAAGKHLFIAFSASAAESVYHSVFEQGIRETGVDSVVWIHLGLIGTFGFADVAPVANPGTLRLRLANDRIAADLRGPQWCRLIGADEAVRQIAAIGPDPLRADADPGRGWERVHASSRPIAELLLDQSITAGVGNIYRAEVLFRQRVDPFQSGQDLSRRSWNRMWADLVQLMSAGMASGRIDTVRPEHSPGIMGRPPRLDQHGGEVYVYRRAGQGCLVCGREILVKPMAGRKLYWCSGCQRRRK